MAKTKCSVLVVDDEPYILSALTAFLKPDYNVAIADSAEAAQKVFAERAPDIILSDLKMPRVSGKTGNLQTFFYDHLFAGWASPENGSLFYALIYILIWLGLMWILYKREIYLKV